MTLATVAPAPAEILPSVLTDGDREQAPSPDFGPTPWVAHVFYAWMPDERCFVFTTDAGTRHGGEMEANSRVAAAIALETRTVGRVQGLQIEGLVHKTAAPSLSTIHHTLSIEKARRAYLKRFPYAAAAKELPLWILEPVHMKLTDNTLGFGKKLIWKKE